MEDREERILSSEEEILNEEELRKFKENLHFPDIQIFRKLADSARIEQKREKILDSGILTDVLWPDSMSVDLLVEVSRLFGNLCFDNPRGREFVRKSGLLDRMHCSVNNQNILLLDSKLLLVIPAFLQNFCIENSGNIELVQPLLELLASEFPIEDIEDISRLTPLENLLCVLAEEEKGQRLFNQNILQLLASLLQVAGAEPSPDLISMLTSLSSEDDRARILLSLRLHEVLMHNIDNGEYSTQSPQEIAAHTDCGESIEDAEKSVQESCCDLLAMVTCQASLEDIDLACVRRWLSSGDTLLVSTGLLILGNLCTSDANIISCITDDLILQLLDLLNFNDIKVRHSLLGCLRNCCVNSIIREKLNKQEFALVLIRLVRETQDIETLLKIVLVLRLLSQNQPLVSRLLGEEADFVDRVVRVGSNSLVFSASLGQLNVEAARLFSSIITQARSDTITRSLVGAGCLPFLTSLLGSSHPILLNQAILPLCLVAAARPLDPRFTECLTEDNLNKLALVLDNQVVPDKIKENVVSLTSAVLEGADPDLRELLRGSQLPVSLANFKLKLEVEEQGNSSLGALEKLLSSL